MVRYRPAASLTWLSDSAEAGFKKAEKLSKQALNLKLGADGTSAKARFVSAGAALFEAAKSAYTEVAKSKMEAHEYALSDDTLFVHFGGKSEEIPFEKISHVEMDGLKAKFFHAKGQLIVQPYAYVVSGAAKAPIGWNRDGHEVPYELLIEEIAARAGLTLK